MTIPASSAVAGPFNGNGSTTVFPFTFKTLDATYLTVVTLISGIETERVKDTDYTVTLNPDQDVSPGGSITYPISGSPLATGSTLTISGNVPYGQTSELPDGGAFRATDVELALDKLAQQILQLSDLQQRALTIRLSDVAAGVSGVLPTAEERALKVLSFDADGNPQAVAPASGTSTDLAISLATTTGGAPAIGFDWAALPAAINKADWGIQTARGGGVNALRYVPPAEWAGVLARTSTTDLSDYIQACINGNAHTYLPGGRWPIAKALIYPTNRRLSGDGVLSTIYALPALASASKPAITGAPTPGYTYTPVLDKVPMLCNTSSIDFWSIDHIWFDGNNQDVYGIWLHENFHGNLDEVYVLNTLNRPYTNIRGQAIEHGSLQVLNCGDATHDGGVVLYDNSNCTFKATGFERIRTATYCLDQRQPDAFAKGGVTFERLWFESDSTHRPTLGFARFSGRGIDAKVHIAADFTATTEHGVCLNDTSDPDRTIDGIAMGSNPCVGANVWINNVSGALLTVALPLAKYNTISGFYDTSKVSDGGVGNTWDLNGSLASPIPHFTGRQQIRNGGTTPSISATAFVADFDWNGGTPIIRWLGSNGNTLDLNGGKLRWTSALGQDYVCTNGSFNWTGTAFFMNSTTGGFVPPQMTTTQRDAMTPSNGYIIFNTTLGKVQIREAGAWVNAV